MSATMPAAVYTLNGVQLESRPVPVIQEPRDTIVRVTRSTICTSDLHILHGAVPQAKPGVILGHEFVGEVVEAGDTDTIFSAPIDPRTADYVAGRFG